MKRMLCCLLCLLLCTPCALAQQPPELIEPVGVQLNAAVATIGEISSITVVEGAVVPYVEEFFFEQEGVVDELHVTIGQMVRQGDALVSMDTESEQKRILALKRELEQLQVNSAYDDELAQIDLQLLDLELRALMTQNPADENAILLKQLDIEEKKLDIELSVQLRSMQMEELASELARLEEEVARNVLYAPFDGRVVYMTAQWQHGDYVGAFTPILYLADDTQLMVESKSILNSLLSSAHAVYAHIGEKHYQLTPVPLDEQEYLAKVLSGEEVTRTYTFNEPDEELRAGQYAAVCVENDYQAQALLVPSNALYAAEKVRYLYVLEDGVRVRREVKVGVRTDWYTQITEGLEEGELVYVQE